MSEISKLEIATVHLRYKLEHANDVERFANLGLLKIEEVSSEILNSIYPLEDVAAASEECVRSGALDAYYLVRCLKCNGISHIPETDIGSSTVLKELITDGPQCHHCSAKLHQDPKKIDVRFAIPNKYLTEADVTDTVDDVATSLKRMLRWLKILK